MAPMAPVLQWLLVFTAARLAYASAAYPSLHLPAFALGDLQAPSAATLAGVRDAIARLGMFAVTGLRADGGDPGHAALSEFVACASREASLQLRQVEMEDGALRRTLATATNASGPLPLPADVLTRCPDFARAAYHLRAAVAAVGTAYGGVLDKLMYGDAACRTPDQCFMAASQQGEGLEHFHLFEPPVASHASSSSSSSSSSSAAAAAAAGGKLAPEHMLAMHSDIGLFLVMSPAELFSRTASYYDGASAADPQPPRRSEDLVVQLPDGRVVAPVLPDGGTLLVMNGEGLTRWMRAPASGGVRPYSPLHEVLSSDLGGDGGGGVVRAWFGRMFMPPPYAQLQVTDSDADADDHTLRLLRVAEKHGSEAGDDVDEGDEYDDDGEGDGDGEGKRHASSLRRPLTFAEYRRHTYTLFHDGRGGEASALGCAPSRRRLVDESSCGASEVYCWHSCMPITPDLTCAKSDILCANALNTSLLWPRDYSPPGAAKPGHCKDCALMCPAAKGLPPSASSFCNTHLGPTTMWMTGFQFARGNEQHSCVVFLFPEWVLDSAGKFAAACVGTLLMGLLVGWLGRLRSRLRERWVEEGRWAPEYSPAWRTWVADAVILGIIAVQVCLGYWLMLVAMTYQAELFIMVVLGLALGHLFARPRPRATGKVTSGGGGGSSSSGSDAYSQQEKLEPCCTA